MVRSVDVKNIIKERPSGEIDVHLWLTVLFWWGGGEPTAIPFVRSCTFVFCARCVFAANSRTKESLDAFCALEKELCTLSVACVCRRLSALKEMDGASKIIKNCAEKS